MFGKKTLDFVGGLIEKIPIFGTVHSAARQFINFIFGADDSKGFKQVVFVPYPRDKFYCAAFLTGEQIFKDKKFLCVFMPTAPNPTSGFLLLCEEKDVMRTDYTVEQAFQFIISVGVIPMRHSNKIELKNTIEEFKDGLQSSTRDA
jgi:uncharacterized membrane protein